MSRSVIRVPYKYTERLPVAKCDRRVDLPTLRRPQSVTSAAPGVAQAVSSSVNSSSRLKNDACIASIIRLALIKSGHNILFRLDRGRKHTARRHIAEQSFHPHPTLRPGATLYTPRRPPGRASRELSQIPV